MIGVGCGARREMEGLWNKNRYGWAVEQEERWREGVDANTCVLLRKGRSCVTMTCADTMYVFQEEGTRSIQTSYAARLPVDCTLTVQMEDYMDEGTNRIEPDRQ
jgi:hypothetical protein